MEPAIIRKLTEELNSGITTEAQVVYLLVEIRKLLEQQNEMQAYEYLTFHCDWALHSKLDRRMAQKILTQFNAANVHLKNGIELEQLPTELRREMRRISKMKYFEREMSDFLHNHRLPGFTDKRMDGWSHFLHLYAKVISDCPLVISGRNNSADVSSVTVHIELANQVIHKELFYKISWTILEKNGKSGEIYILNSFKQLS